MSKKNKDSSEKLMEFIKRPPNVTPIEECMLYTKEILISRLFLGSYLERRYVPLLDEYRDVIVISREETELNQDLKIVTQKWAQFLKIKWTGITPYKDNTEEQTFCFWVKLPNLTFDYYWFQIRNIKLLENELNLRIKCIRKASFITQLLPLKTSIENNALEELEDSHFNACTIQDYAKTYCNLIKKKIKNIYVIVQPNLTWKNLFSVIRVFIAFLLICISTLLFCIKSFADYLLVFLHEISLLIEAVTPITLQIIDFFSKVVGGFFILIAGVVRAIRYPEPYGNNKNVYLKSLPTTSSLNTDWRERNRILRQELLTQNGNKCMPSSQKIHEAHSKYF